MAAVEPAVDPQLLDGSCELSRAELPFAPILALARMLIGGIGMLEGSEHLGNGFLVNLEALFELTVVRALRENEIDVVPKSPLSYSRWDGAVERGGSAFQLDALCRGLPSGDVIVDAKYKRKIASANLHQMIAYAAMTGVTRCVLVVPGGLVTDLRTYLFDRATGGRLRIEVLELATDAVDLAGWRQNARRLAEQLTADRPT